MEDDYTFDTAIGRAPRMLMQKFVICPKHGEHSNVIVSTIPGHEGVWCQICWLDLLGEPLPFVEKPFHLYTDKNETT